MKLYPEAGPMVAVKHWQAKTLVALTTGGPEKVYQHEGNKLVHC
jgi:hypothetical protein